MIPPQQQWPRGPVNELHGAAKIGSTERTIALLSRGSINIDQGTLDGSTPLVYSAQGGHSRVTRILLNRGANVSIAKDGGATALHFSAQNGHLAVTVDLVAAGADLDARDREGATPLHFAAQQGHSEVMVALVEAGTDVDSRSGNGRTPLFLAASTGRLDAVKELLRMKANPLSGVKAPRGFDYVPLNVAAFNGHLNVVHVPLNVAAFNGHLNVVHVLIQQVGMEGCGGESRGVHALECAARKQHVDIMTMLMDAGVVDTELALFSAVDCGQEKPVKLLLRQRRRQGPTVDYVNTCNIFGMTPLCQSIGVGDDAKGVPHLIPHKVVRLLIDAGADTASAVRVTSTAGDEVLFNDTPLSFTNDCLRTKKVGVGGVKDATEEQMNRLEAVRRLLLRVEAAHAMSWLWVRDPLLVGGAAEVSSRTAMKTAGGGTQLRLMLPALRRRRRGVLLAPLFRYASYP